MKKDVEWLKKRELIANIKSLAREVSQEWPHKEVVGLCDVLSEIDLLVPKQELPVIPKLMAEWIEEAKQDELPLYIVIGRFINKGNRELEVWKSANKNVSEIVARAWLDGYTVEKEPLYTARLKVITGNGIESYLRTQSSDTEDRLEMLEVYSKYIHEDYRPLSEFTEHELKVLDIWDNDQWVVEEVEE